MDSRNGVPENWFIDVLRLGVSGAYSDGEETNPLSWQADAVCAQTDPEAFFPEKGGSTRDAKRICAGCGLSERERRKLKKRA